MKIVKCIIMAFAVVVTSCSTGNKVSPEDVVKGLKKSDKLYVTECAVHKLITANDLNKVNGSVMGKKFSFNMSIGDRKIAIPMNCVLKAYVDFDSLKVEDVNITENGIMLMLDEPKVEMTSSKIDHVAIKEFTGILRSSFSDEEMTDLERQGRDAVLASIPNMGIVENAKQNAVATLIPILMNSGFASDEIQIDFKTSKTDKK